MIDPDKRNAVYQLHCEGVSLRKISRLLHISYNTVSRIVQQQGKVPLAQRKDCIQIDQDLLRRLYQQCDGWMQRIHEKLLEEEDIQVGYSTLTRMLREAGIGNGRKDRCGQVPDQPGEEMQHDTSDYRVKLSGQQTKVIGSLLYLRYSKRRYLKFYRAFNRFAMKCFLHEALMFWEHSALKIYRRRELLVEYPLPANGVKRQRYSPPGQPQPKYQPRPRKRDSRYEEQRLRALGEEVESYLDYALKAPGIQRHRFLRELFAFSRQVTSVVFVKMAQRALRYRIIDLDALRRIAWYCMSQEGLALPEAEVDENLQQRPAYQEGYLTEEPDLSIYDDMFQQTDQDEDPSEESEDQDG